MHFQRCESKNFDAFPHLIGSVVKLLGQLLVFYCMMACDVLDQHQCSKAFAKFVPLTASTVGGEGKKGGHSWFNNYRPYGGQSWFGGGMNSLVHQLKQKAEEEQIMSAITPVIQNISKQKANASDDPDKEERILQLEKLVAAREATESASQTAASSHSLEKEVLAKMEARQNQITALHQPRSVSAEPQPRRSAEDYLREAEHDRHLERER